MVLFWLHPFSTFPESVDSLQSPDFLKMLFPVVISALLERCPLGFHLKHYILIFWVDVFQLCWLSLWSVLIILSMAMFEFLQCNIYRNTGIASCWLPHVRSWCSLKLFRLPDFFVYTNCPLLFDFIFTIDTDEELSGRGFLKSNKVLVISDVSLVSSLDFSVTKCDPSTFS